MGFLGGVGSGIIITIINNRMQEKQSKQQKRQHLYGKLLSLKSTLSDYSLYNSTARINFYYNGIWERLSSGEAKEISSQERKAWQQNIKETEIICSNKFSELFETLGLIWAVFPKNKEIEKHIKSCFNIIPVPIQYPEKIEKKGETSHPRRRPCNPPHRDPIRRSR